MRKIIVLGTLFAVGSANAAVTLSNPVSVPSENVAISQPNSSGSAIQSRNRGPNPGDDWRAITQTFVWPSVEDFDGLGLYLGGGNDGYWSATATQTYTLIIQDLDNSTSPTATVLNVEFQLTGDKVSDGQWLYIDTENVALRQNIGRYGLTIAPVEDAIAPNLRTFWATADTDGYAPGLARQYAPPVPGGLPKTDAYTTGGSANDYAFFMIHSPSVILSNPSNAPTKNVVVSQLDSTGSFNVQARNRGSNGIDWRGISQTFLWTSTDGLDGAGFFMGAGNDALWSGTSTQTYALIIQALDNNTPTATVANIQFELTGDKVKDSQWLYLDFPDVALASNQWYGFTLCPPANAVDVNLRTFWDTASADAYPGLARQFDPNEFGLPISGSYTNGGGVPDYTFYLVQAIDEGATPPATIAGFVPVSAGVMKMTISVPGNPALYHPESSPSLTPGAWSVAAHSSDGTPGSFAITNLDYSTPSGDDVVIYLETEGSTGFFNIVGVPQ